MKLSIVIPAHNEEHRLPPMLEAYAGYFAEKYGNEVELIVVPNFCSDRTAEIARGIGARYPQVRVVEELQRVGKGGAVMLGAKSAQGGLVGFVDADGATPPAAFDDLVQKISLYGCIIASRWMKGSDVSPKQPLSRRVASRCFNGLVRSLFGLKLTDTQCGAKLFRREVILPVLRNLGVTNWAFDVDMLFQTKRLGFSIREIPTVWHDVAGSKIAIGHSSVAMFVALVRLRMFYSPLRFMIPVFSRLAERLLRYSG
ncbi:MAG TPA: glycosyltransferase family 2 protein [Pontiellaceae bacterium]|nr:glycosyltransferase family 2 protein [Pontiellaceae bacterium]HPR82932.1 glycosyltransferase family 2 protein [Pontiellaceae bacterium]